MSENTLTKEVRRYVGKKETIAYVLNDVAASLNIDDYKERYIYDVVNIDFLIFWLYRMSLLQSGTLLTTPSSVFLLTKPEHDGVNSDPTLFWVRFPLQSLVCGTGLYPLFSPAHPVITFQNGFSILQWV